VKIDRSVVRGRAVSQFVERSDNKLRGIALRRAKRETRDAAAATDVVRTRIEKIHAAFEAGGCEKVVVVRDRDVGGEHALKGISHFGKIVLEIDVIGIPDVFDIKIRKCLPRILEKLCQLRMNFAVGN
jgi:hypothetical protein